VQDSWNVQFLVDWFLFWSIFLWSFQVLMIVIVVPSEEINSSLARFILAFFAFAFYLVQV
jgi:hypothetical protein